MKLTSRFTCNVVANADWLPRPTFARCAISPTPMISTRRRLQRAPRSWQMRSQAQGSQETAQAVAEQGLGPSTSGNGGAALSLRPIADRDWHVAANAPCAAMRTTADQRQLCDCWCRGCHGAGDQGAGHDLRWLQQQSADTLQVKKPMSLSASRLPRWPAGQASV